MNTQKPILRYKPLLLAYCLITLSLNAPLAQSEALYGPVKYGQTLLEIATEVRPDDSVSIEQFAYAIYKLNPNAFDNNMNVLKAGVKLKFPNKKSVLSLSRGQANKVLAKHQREILILRASAKKLSSAKNVYSKNKQKVKKLRKKLARFKHKSSKWKRTYKKLMFAVKMEKKAASIVKKQRKALLAKAQIEAAGTDNPGSSDSVSNNNSSNPTHNASIEARITALQTQMKAMISAQRKEASKHNKEINEIRGKLKASNQNLEKKAKQQEKMEQRVSVLEGELGKKEKIILSLRSTLRTASETMKQQQAENKKLFERLKEINPNDTLLGHNRLELQNVAPATNSGSDTGTDAPPKTNTDAQIIANKASTLSNDTVKASIDSSSGKKQNKIANTASGTASSSKLEAALRSSKRQQRINAATMQSKQEGSWTSLSYWLSLIKEKPLIFFIIMGSFSLLIAAFMIKKQRKKKKEMKLAAGAMDPEININDLENGNNTAIKASVHNLRKVG